MLMQVARAYMLRPYHFRSRWYYESNWRFLRSIHIPLANISPAGLVLGAVLFFSAAWLSGPRNIDGVQNVRRVATASYAIYTLALFKDRKTSISKSFVSLGSFLALFLFAMFIVWAPYPGWFNTIMFGGHRTIYYSFLHSLFLSYCKKPRSRPLRRTAYQFGRYGYSGMSLYCAIWRQES
jgi:hypothetical protein